MSSAFVIEDELKKLPKQPGVYIMHDKNDAIIYVGKAVSLRNRVRQYFQSTKNKSPKVIRMASQVDHFEYIVTDSELEALVLESNLIKENRPKYNTMLKDDKTYPYIKITLGEMYPRIMISRQMKKDSSKYFGPYPTAGAVKDTVELLQKLFRIRKCNVKLPENIGKERACLYYHLGQCDAPCLGVDYIRPEEYRKQVDRAVDFLNGNTKTIRDELTQKMLDASADMRFEEAAGIRDTIESIDIISEKQKITLTNDDEDRDVIALAADTVKENNSSLDRTEAVAQVFFIRGGKLIGREHFFLTVDNDQNKEQMLSSFITQYYAGTPFIPKEIMLEEALPDQELLEEYLTKKRGKKVTIRVPQRGTKEKMVELAKENAEMVLSRDRERLQREAMRTTGAVKEIADLLKLPELHRMEAYDISNISGVNSVGSMVVFEDGKPKRTDYRKFRIKTVVGPDDYASMREVLTRRFKRALEESEGFRVLPDLVLMDGGRGQVNIAEDVLHELKLRVPVAGMVKDDYHRTRGIYYHGVEMPIDRNSEGFKLITRIQDEAHRFAITYHRQLRSKGQVHSILDDIEGIGPTRRKALLRAFKTPEKIRDASIDELEHTESMNRAAAEKVWEFFHKKDAKDKENMVH